MPVPAFGQETQAGAGMQLRAQNRRVGAGRIGVALLLALTVAACASSKREPTPSVVGLWTVQEVAGAPALADTRVTLSLYGDGRAVGRGGCSNFTTSYKQSGAAITFSPILSTKMACSAEIMTQERAYFTTLAAATHAERRPDGTVALASDSGGALILRREESAALHDARARGIDFRAVGQEPAWVVELKEGDHITALLDYGATSLLLPTPEGQNAPDGTLTYDATTDTDHLTLAIKTKVCVDVMSGESHPAIVTLTVNDKTYNGCGDWLD